MLAPWEGGEGDPGGRIGTTPRGSITYEVFVSAAGRGADDGYAMAGGPRAFRVRPFKGEYYIWRDAPLRTMIYPVPRSYLRGSADDGRHVSDLGIHVHRSVAGPVFVGPTHVEVDAGRKGDYRITSPKEIFVAAARRYAENVGDEAFSPAYAGNRPKLFEGGQPAGDFQVVREGVHLHLLGIESPGLTAAPALARRVAALASDILA